MNIAQTNELQINTLIALLCTNIRWTQYCGIVNCIIILYGQIWMIRCTWDSDRKALDDVISISLLFIAIFYEILYEFKGTRWPRDYI